MKTSFIPERVREQAIDWLLRSRSDAFTEKDRADLDAWLEENPLHARAYLNVTEHWQWLDRFKTAPFPAREAALHYRKRPAARPLWSYAAAAMVVIGVIYGTFSADGGLGLTHTYRTATGERQTVTLADGSRIELNTGTEVRVRFNRSRRQVDLLHGEAFFTVRHDGDRPFEVAAGNGVIRDLGTAFNVYVKPERVDVTVEEGRVSVETREDRRDLTAGQQTAYRDGAFIAADGRSIASATAWRQGLLSFQGLRLDEALAEIGRYHDVAIRVPDPELAKLRVNGTFRTGELNAMLDAVGALLPVTAKWIGEREIVLEARR